MTPVSRKFPPPEAVVYILLLVLFVCHQLMILNHIPIRLLDDYLDDLLVFPILLPVVGWIRMKLHWSDRITLPGYLIAISVLFYSLWFEIISPFVFHRGESDVWDMVMYGTGAFSVWVWGRWKSQLR